MHSYLKVGYYLLGLLGSSLLLSAQGQPQIVKLWPAEIPGSIASETYKETIIYRDPVAKTSPRISKVTEPTLEVYPAPADKNTGAAVVICPGGGYAVLAYDHEGQQVANWFNQQGITGVVLKYRLPSDEIMKDKSVGPLQDVQEAIRTVRRHAAEWKINPAKIGVMGFSAGGSLAGCASTLYAEPVYTPSDATSARPDFSILVYGVLSMQEEITHKGSKNNLLGATPEKAQVDRFSTELRVDANTPPAFLVHSQDDKTVPMDNSIRYFQAMKAHGVPGELHLYEKGGHGYGLGINPGSPSHWPEDLKLWLKAHGIL